MRLSKHFLGGLMTAWMAVSAACVNSPTGPVFLLPANISGRVFDDSGELPGGQGLALAGVRVEVLEGPDRGRFAITGPDGNYDLGQIATPTHVRATKEGWESFDNFCEIFFSCSTFFVLGQVPHVLSGMTVQRPPGGTDSPLAGVRVEIIGGQNGGNVAFSDAAGAYRLDGLVTSPEFIIEFTKAGFITGRVTVESLRRNTQQFRVMAPQ